LPAWNEEDSLERAVSRATKVLARVAEDWEIIIVDDASTDRTGPMADLLADKNARVKVVHHERRLARSGAIKTGLAASTKDVVVWCDADLPFDLGDLERALRLLEELEGDLVCAFRHDRGGEGLKGFVSSLAYDLLVRGLFDVAIHDVNFGFKVVHRRVLEAIELNSEGRFIEAELVVKAMKRGFRVLQLGVDWFPRARGEATASPAELAKLLGELVQLYAETKQPGEPRRPVRLPPTVKALRGRKVAGVRAP
jgi:glycosyltransferase involved in cell wall biosynthesis